MDEPCKRGKKEEKGLHWFLTAPVTKCFKCGQLKTTEIYCLNSGGQKSEMKMSRLCSF